MIVCFVARAREPAGRAVKAAQDELPWGPASGPLSRMVCIEELRLPHLVYTQAQAWIRGHPGHCAHHGVLIAERAPF
jgi:hypothetical protein